MTKVVILSNLGTPNRSGIVIPKDTAQRIVDDRANKLTFGEIGKLDNTKHLDLTRISHVVENVRVEGDTLVGDVRTLDTPDGIKLNMFISDAKFALAGYAVMDGKTVKSIAVHSINAVQK